MNYNYIGQSGNVQYNVVELIIDTAAEIIDLPTNVAPGSTCFVIENSTAYMLNGNGEWKELQQEVNLYGYYNFNTSKSLFK